MPTVKETEKIIELKIGKTYFTINGDRIKVLKKYDDVDQYGDKLYVFEQRYKRGTITYAKFYMDDMFFIMTHQLKGGK